CNLVKNQNPMTSGYSGTPLAKKLGLKSNHHYLLYQQPGHYFELFSDLPELLHPLQRPQTKSADFIHLFFTSRDTMEAIVPQYIDALKWDGTLWISWPKGASKIPTDLKRDVIREHLLASGLVDVKVAAVDADWSGLKFMYRKEDR
ncbi:MAG: hypothetical protein MI700_04315, partial [Balneolales bacterium]|nr:hypothetical protein [Balneolales bacterium]